MSGAAVGSGGTHFEITRFTEAPPAEVWRLLADHAGYRNWTPIPISELVVEGEPTGGVGAVRRLGTSFFSVRERITAWNPPTSMSYTIDGGLDVTGYVATVTLELSSTGGTRIRWEGDFERGVGGFDSPTRWALKAAVSDLARRVAREAERVSGRGRPSRRS